MSGQFSWHKIVLLLAQVVSVNKMKCFENNWCHLWNLHIYNQTFSCNNILIHLKPQNKHLIRCFGQVTNKWLLICIDCDKQKAKQGWCVVYTEIVMFFLSQRTNTKFICIQYLSIQENSLTLPVLWTYILASFTMIKW